MSNHSSEEVAYSLKKRLLTEYQGNLLEDIFPARHVETGSGSYVKIETREKLVVNFLDKETAIGKISKDLKLVPGIGEVKEQYLKREGYNNISQLMDHPKFCGSVCCILEALESEDPVHLRRIIAQKYSPTHLSVLLSSAFQDPEDYLFMDIETLGLKNEPLILIGAAKLIDNQIQVKQYLLKDLNQEGAVLKGFIDELSSDNIYVTYNGLSFDLPYIRSRLRYNNIHHTLNGEHLDLLHFSRRAWRTQLPNCRLQTLEAHLFNLERVDDVPSSLVPEYYKTYLKTGNIGPLVPIIEHNKQDIISLVFILSQLHQVVEDNI